MKFSPLNLPPINVGIGISTGECIVGNMGSEIRFDYSVIGDAVNLGARLEGQTRNYDGVDLLLSERTYRLCTSFKEVDRILVKGKSEYTHHWELIDHPTNFDWTLFVTLQLADIYTTYRGLKYNCIKKQIQ